jgi:hypothetical protein
LLSLAIDMGLKFPIRQTDVHGILHRREMDWIGLSMTYPGMTVHLVFPLCLHIRGILFYWVIGIDGFNVWTEIHL